MEIAPLPDNTPPVTVGAQWVIDDL